MEILKKLGDSHNGGRYTSLLKSGQVFKPRPVFWEKLFLDGKSELRILLNRLLSNASHGDPLNVLPSLNFKAVDPIGATQDFIRTEPLTQKMDDAATFYSVGIVIGICEFFGVVDLHKDNILFGRGQHGIIFVPVDIECLFQKIETLSDTSLVPGPGLKPDFAGLSALRTYVQSFGGEANIDCIVSGFRFCLEVLIKNADKIGQLISGLPNAKHEPVRIVIRQTDTYVNILSGTLDMNDLSIPLLFEEQMQLNQNDVPYFFRYPYENQLMYFDMKLKPIDVRPSFALDSIYKTRLSNPANSLDQIDQPFIERESQILRDYLTS